MAPSLAALRAAVWSIDGEAPISAGKLSGLGRWACIAAVAATICTFVGGGIAYAETAAITQAKSEAQALQDKVDQLSNQLDQASEDYDYAKAQLTKTNTAVKQSAKNLTQAEGDLTTAQNTLNTRIVSIYENGETSTFELLASSESIGELMERVSLLQRMSKQDADLVLSITSYRDKVAKKKAELAVQQTRQKQLTAQTEAAKKKVQVQLVTQQKELAGKESLIAQLQKDEAARQAQLAAEARARLENGGTQYGGGTGGAGTVSGSKVVNIAMQYLGCEYVWGESSPSGFDCSGFVMYVYAKVGVSLPHSSRMQYSCGTPVSRENLRPGDLVFFYNPIHHVGIYIGSDQMIDAAGTGKGVRIDSLWSSYVGACRI